MSVKPIPDGYNTITTCFTTHDTAAAIEFYKNAFNAVEKFRLAAPNGSIAYAEIGIGNSSIMLGDECPEMGAKSPKKLGGSSAGIYLYVDDVDKGIEQAVKAGATLRYPAENKFYGDRSGSVEDPFGYMWHLATHVEDVPPEEMQERAKKEWEKHPQ